MKELALVVIVFASLALAGGLAEVHRAPRSKCWDVGGVDVCVGRDEKGGW